MRVFICGVRDRTSLFGASIRDFFDDAVDDTVDDSVDDTVDEAINDAVALFFFSTTCFFFSAFVTGFS